MVQTPTTKNGRGTVPLTDPFFIPPSQDPSINNEELVNCVNQIKLRFTRCHPQLAAAIDRQMQDFDMRSPEWVRVWFERGVMVVTPGRRLVALAADGVLITNWMPGKTGPEDTDLVS